jgi:hypothetical protein
MRSDHLLLGQQSVVAVGDRQSRSKKAEFHGVMSQKWNIDVILHQLSTWHDLANKRLILWSKPVRIRA